MVSGEARGSSGGAHACADDTKKMDRRRRSTDVTWWVNQLFCGESEDEARQEDIRGGVGEHVI